ncbi:hypothetical protein RHS01_07743 [Rhizoctonia solani]|uniref:Golgi apparatus membrane protein TVP38 n=1 Tax=Rhizoctonia solani TaxID=456999 RepID=A0A8H7IC63_9AGAM|nr:hypothetical protein RHS01_07743 [Rhizoctonia solani]
MAGLRLLSVLLAAQCVSGAPSWLAKRWTLPPAAALNGVLPAWLDLPDGEDVIRQFGLDLDQYSVQVLNIPGYANWTSNGWHVRLHGQTYRIPALAGSDIDDLAKPFVQELIMTIARARLPQRTDERGEFDAFVNVNVSTGTVPNGDQTEFTQGIQLFANGSTLGNASSYFVPTHGFTLITDIDDILRETRVYEPDAGMRNSYIYPFKPWRNMPDVFRLWQSVSPSLHFHYLSTIPIKLSRPYMNFIYGTYPIGSFDVRPMNYTTLSHVSESRRLNLEQILQSFPQRKFILLGETSNADIMTQYPIMAKKYIDRVQCVLLRNTSATDSGDFLPYDTSGLVNLDQQRWMFFRTPDDIAGLNFTNGECRNSSVPQNVTFDFEGVPRLLNAASPRVGSMPFAYGLALLLGASLGLRNHTRVFHGNSSTISKAKLIRKGTVCFIVASQIALATIFIMLGADQIFQFLYDSAQKLKAMPAGWAILSAAIGGDYAQGTVITVCGFAYGVKAFSFVAPAACIGAAFTFICLRCFFHERARRYTRNKEHWRALEAVVATKGLPLVVLIRLAPIPWTYSNALFASIESVRFWQFMVATVVYTPKLFVMVFIASRVAKFSDGQQRSEMDSTTKWINGLSIVLGASIAFAAGW